MKEELVKKLCLGYVRLFPELLDRYYKDGDLTIIKLLLEKISESKEIYGILDISKLENKIKLILKEL